MLIEIRGKIPGKGYDKKLEALEEIVAKVKAGEVADNVIVREDPVRNLICYRCLTPIDPEDILLREKNGGISIFESYALHYAECKVTIQ